MANGRNWFLISGVLLVIIIGLPLIRKFIFTRGGDLTRSESTEDSATALTSVQ